MSDCQRQGAVETTHTHHVSVLLIRTGHDVEHLGPITKGTLRAKRRTSTRQRRARAEPMPTATYPHLTRKSRLLPRLPLPPPPRGREGGHNSHPLSPCRPLGLSERPVVEQLHLRLVLLEPPPVPSARSSARVARTSGVGGPCAAEQRLQHVQPWAARLASTREATRNTVTLEWKCLVVVVWWWCGVVWCGVV